MMIETNLNRRSIIRMTASREHGIELFHVDADRRWLVSKLGHWDGTRWVQTMPGMEWLWFNIHRYLGDWLRRSYRKLVAMIGEQNPEIF